MKENLTVSSEILQEYKPSEIIDVVSKTMFDQQKNSFLKISKTKIRKIITNSCLKRLIQISDDLKEVGL